MFTQLEFINWTVEGKREVVVIPKSGEVIRGTALVYYDDTLHIEAGNIVHKIQVELISDIFSIQRKSSEL